jgi:hypothetical protein
VQYSQKDDLCFLNFVHRDERERRKNELASALYTPGATTIRERAEPANCIRDFFGHTAPGGRTIAGYVVANVLKIIGRIRRPADPHHPR